MDQRKYLVYLHSGEKTIAFTFHLERVQYQSQKHLVHFRLFFSLSSLKLKNFSSPLFASFLLQLGTHNLQSKAQSTLQKSGGCDLNPLRLRDSDMKGRKRTAEPGQQSLKLSYVVLPLKEGTGLRSSSRKSLLKSQTMDRTKYWLQAKQRNCLPFQNSTLNLPDKQAISLDHREHDLLGL